MVKGKKYYNKCVSVINRNGLFGLYEILDYFILLFIILKLKILCKRFLIVLIFDCIRMILGSIYVSLIDGIVDS